MNMKQMQELRELRLKVVEMDVLVNRLMNQVEELNIKIEAKPKRGRPRKNNA